MILQHWIKMQCEYRTGANKDIVVSFYGAVGVEVTVMLDGRDELGAPKKRIVNRGFSGLSKWSSFGNEMRGS